MTSVSSVHRICGKEARTAIKKKKKVDRRKKTAVWGRQNHGTFRVGDPARGAKKRNKKSKIEKASTQQRASGMEPAQS